MIDDEIVSIVYVICLAGFYASIEALIRAFLQCGKRGLHALARYITEVTFGVDDRQGTVVKIFSKTILGNGQATPASFWVSIPKKNLSSDDSRGPTQHYFLKICLGNGGNNCNFHISNSKQFGGDGVGTPLSAPNIFEKGPILR
jgi:hypothetical protein